MDRRQKEKEFFAHHAETFKKLKLPNPIFILKTAFYEKGKYGRNIQLYESELKKNEDIYMEFIREKTDYSVYIVSVSELMVILPDGSEISYSLYEKRKEEGKKKEESLPKLQSSLVVFPDFEEEFIPKLKESVESSEDVSSILLEIANNFQRLATALKNK